jgi:D-3-phosphoglycerate dehydrogenase
MTGSRLLITCGHLQRNIGRYRAGIEAQGVELVVPPLTAQQFSAGEMKSFIADVDTVIAGDDMIDGDVLALGKANRLKAVVKWGIGTDSIDKEAARRLGLPVYNTPGAFSDEVADLALGLLLALVRHIPQIDAKIRDGAWPRHEGMSLAGKTAGVVGLGGIGRAIAVRCKAFGMSVAGSDVVTLPESEAKALSLSQRSLEEVLAVSDVVILACNLTADNRHMIDAAALRRMKPGAVLVNVARGPLVDEQALIAALRTGHIGGVALDVFETEPLPADSPLRALPNCVFGSHGGSSTAEAIDRINRLTLEIARNVMGVGKSDMSSFNRVA